MNSIVDYVNECKRLMHSFGLSPKRVGFSYLVDLFEFSYHGGIFPLSRRGYVMVAEKENKSPLCIDKSIQNVISCACNCTNVDELYRVFGNTIDENRGKPTNKHFISTILELVSVSQ